MATIADDEDDKFDTSYNGDSEEEITLLKDGGEPSLEYEGTPHISCQRNFADCSNVFKAFIGSAMIGLPFATLQAGIGFAVIGIFIIAFLTDHCCLLIVKCKKIVIKNIIDAKREEGMDETTLKREMYGLGRDLSFGKIGSTVLGKPGVVLINTSLMVTQFGFTIGYFIFLGNTMRSLIKYFAHNSAANTTHNASLVDGNLIDGAILNSKIIPINGTITALGASVSHYLGSQLVTSISPHLLNSSVGFALFLSLPLPLLILISLVRNLRKLAPVSVIANASITFAFGATALFIITQTKSLPDPILWYKVTTFPIFFGQVTSAFEGIGTVIPIEGSMAENRPKYPAFMHISITGLALILSSFGIIGYLAYGDKTCQIITANLHGPIAIALQVLLFIGVLFTYPLQIYPCIQITEHLILKFRMWNLIRKHKRKQLASESDGEEAEALIDDYDDDNSSRNLVRLKRWESNVIRVVLVTFTAGVALIFRFQFAYIAALTGSIGSSLLSFIIPAVIHMRLTKNNRRVKIKDVLLIIFGITGGVCGVTVTIMELIESFNGTIPAHC